MAKNSKRSVSRKMKRTNKHKRTHRRNRRYGGQALSGAPVNYHLSGDWSSRMSLGQGADYFKYHEGQHGGRLDMGPFPVAVLSSGLPQDLRGPAHIGGIDQAIADVRPLKDPNQAGGRRKKYHSRKNKSKKGKKSSHNKKNRSKRNKRNKKSGGSLGYAPFPSSGMLLDSSKEYAQAGLNPEWKTDVAFTDAKIRDTQ
jgi:hypothetical protein